MASADEDDIKAEHTPPDTEKSATNTEEEAAVRIQSAHRGHKTRQDLRKELKPQKLAAAKTQLHPTSCIAKLRTSEIEIAAVKIQSAQRGHITRQNLRKELQPQNLAVAKIQPEAKNAELKASVTEIAAVKIQSAQRGRTARQNLKKLFFWKKAEKEQLAAPQDLLQPKSYTANRRDTEAEIAAVRIQSAQRGRMARQNLTKLFVWNKAKPRKPTSAQDPLQPKSCTAKHRASEFEVAALRIQSAFRGFSARQNLKKRAQRQKAESQMLAATQTQLQPKSCTEEEEANDIAKDGTSAEKQDQVAYRRGLAVMRSGIVRQSEYPDMPSLELIEEVFIECDANQDGRLSEQDILRFVRCLDYPDDDVAWAVEYKALCKFHGWNPDEGLNLEGFVTIIDDTTDNYNCDIETLEVVLEELRCLTPSSNTNTTDIQDARVSAGMDSMEHGVFENVEALQCLAPSSNTNMSDMQDMHVCAGMDGRFENAQVQIEVPVTIKMEGMDFQRLMANNGLRDRCAANIRVEIARWVGVDIDAVGGILLKLGSVLVNTKIVTSSFEEARAVQHLDVAVSLREHLPAAIRKTPGIQDVLIGPVKAVEVSFGKPAPVARGHATAGVGLSARSDNCPSPHRVMVRGRTVWQEHPSSGKASSSGKLRDESSDQSQYPEKEHLSTDGESTRASCWDERSCLSDSPSEIGTACSTAPCIEGSKLQQRRSKKQAKVRTGLESFKSLLRKREQSLAGAWRRCLDPKWRGRLAMSEFLDACRRLGYRQNMHQVWRDLDIHSVGTITFSDLSFEESVMLGEFHALLLREYGSCQAAAKSWGMVGPKRIHLDEWMTLCTKRHLCNSSKEADKLFRLLCSCPLQGVGSAFQGSLGPELSDKAAAVSSKVFSWLSKIGPTFQRPSRNRVVPGSLGNSSPPTPTDQEIGGVRSPSHTSNTFEAGLAVSSGDDRGEEEYESECASVVSSDNCNSRCMHLYSQALEYHKRRASMAEQAPKEPAYNRELPTQELYDRLHLQAFEKQLRTQETLRAAEEESLRTASFGQLKKPADLKSMERLLTPRKRQGNPRVVADTWRQYSWSTLEIDELMVEADKMAKEIAASQQKKYEDASSDVESEEILPWRSFGKTRKELLAFLGEAHAKLKAEKDKDVVRKMPKQAERVLNNAEVRSGKRQELFETWQNKTAKQEEETWKCDMHLDKPCKTCHMCQRWKARVEGTCAVDAGAWKRVVNFAADQSANKVQVWESMFEDLLDEADKKGLLLQRDLPTAKLALKDAFVEDQRWDVVRGVNRDRLIEKAMAKCQREKEEAEKEGRPWRKQVVPNPGTYYRLFLDAAHKEINLDKMKTKAQEEEQCMKDASIHKGTGDPDVFHRLYRNDKKERQEIPVNQLNELAGLSQDTPWKHKVWQEPESQCISCGRDVFTGYKTLPLASFQKGAHICDECIDKTLAVNAESQDLVGKRVWVSWRGNYWYRASVKQMNADGTLSVVYEDDGKCDLSVPRSYIQAPETKHSKYEPGYHAPHAPSKREKSPASPKIPVTGPAEDSIALQKEAPAQVLRFTFPDAPWPPTKYFNSEFCYNLEMIGARNLGDIKLRFKEASENGGIIAELGTTDEKLKMIQRLPVGNLVVTGHAVSEVWCQDAEEEPLADFADWIESAFGSLEEAFQSMVIISGSGTTRRTLSRREFLQASLAKGFHGDAKFVWHALNTGTDMLTMAEFEQLRPYLTHRKWTHITARESLRPDSSTVADVLEPEQDVPLHEFAKLVKGLFPDFKTAFMHLDSGQRGVISFTDFSSGVESIGWIGDCKSVFRKIDQTRKGFIHMQEWQDELSKVIAIVDQQEQRQEQSARSSFSSSKGIGKSMNPAKGKGYGQGHVYCQQGSPREANEERQKSLCEDGQRLDHMQTQAPMEAQLLQARGSNGALAYARVDLSRNAELSVPEARPYLQPEENRNAEASLESAPARATAQSNFRRVVTSASATQRIAAVGQQRQSQQQHRANEMPRSAQHAPNQCTTSDQASHGANQEVAQTKPNAVEEPSTQHARNKWRTRAQAAIASQRVNREAAQTRLDSVEEPSVQHASHKFRTRAQAAIASQRANHGAAQMTANEGEERSGRHAHNKWRAGVQAATASQRACRGAAQRRPNVVEEPRRSVISLQGSVDSPNQLKPKAKSRLKDALTAVRQNQKRASPRQSSVIEEQSMDSPNQAKAKAKARSRAGRQVVGRQAIEETGHPDRVPQTHEGGSDEEIWESDDSPRFATMPEGFEPQSPKLSSLKQRARQTIFALSAGQRIADGPGGANLVAHMNHRRQHSKPGASSEVNKKASELPFEAGVEEVPVDAPLRDFTEALLESYQDLETAFRMMDFSGTGKISMSEFRTACKSVGYIGDASELFHLIDVRDIGCIRKRDFAQLLRYVPQFQFANAMQQVRQRHPCNNQEVKKCILEQQWTRKPSVAKATLVINAQQKATD